MQLFEISDESPGKKRLRGKQPEVPAVSGGSSGATGSSTIEEGRDFEVGFDDQLLLPWRRSSSKADKDLGLPIEVHPSMDSSATAVAEWPCGFRRTIPGLTWGELRKKTSGRVSNSSSGSGLHFSAEQVGTKHAITISQRLDRRLLLSLYEQSRQVLQLPISMFGPVTDEFAKVADDSPALMRAMDIMLPIAKDFAAGLLKREGWQPYEEGQRQEGSV